MIGHSAKVKDHGALPARADMWAPKLPGSRSQPHVMLSCPLWRPSAAHTSVSALASCSASAPCARVSRVAHSRRRQAQAAVRLSQRHLSISASFSAETPAGIYLHRRSVHDVMELFGTAPAKAHSPCLVQRGTTNSSLPNLKKPRYCVPLTPRV